MKIEAPQTDLMDKCRVMLAQCKTDISENMDNKAELLKILHKLEILEMLIQGLQTAQN